MSVDLKMSFIENSFSPSTTRSRLWSDTAFSCLNYLASFNLEYIQTFSLSFITLIFWRIQSIPPSPPCPKKGGGRFTHFGLIWCFLVIRLRLYILGYNSAQVMYASWSITLEVHDAHLSLYHNINFVHTIKMLLNFFTVQIVIYYPWN